MSELSIKLSWLRNTEALQPNKYSTDHTIQYNEHFSVQGSAAPDWGGNPDCTNPEQALAAALSSCHMMTFLSLAAMAKWPVLDYSDFAIANLSKNDAGLMAVGEITIHPEVGFDHGFVVSEEQLIKMHDRAHRYCFIANSINTATNIKPVLTELSDVELSAA